MEAIDEARKIWPGRPVCLVSVGTGLSYKIRPKFEKDARNYVGYVFEDSRQVFPHTTRALPKNAFDVWRRAKRLTGKS